MNAPLEIKIILQSKIYETSFETEQNLEVA